MRHLFAICIVAALVTAGCAGGGGGEVGSIDHRAEMRDLVSDISAHARSRDPAFVVIPQNGHDLITIDGEADGDLATEYLDAIDGMGREDLHYGYDKDDEPTPPGEKAQMIAFLSRAKDAGVVPLVTDYASTRAHVDDAYAQNAGRGFLSFVADDRDLDNIPTYPAAPAGAGAHDVRTLANAKNFLYVLDPSGFADRPAFLNALGQAPHDVLIVEAFPFDEVLTSAEVDSLSAKPGGGARLVVAYMSIGEAEDYRDYWKAGWREGAPAFLAEENPDWPGNYKVRYWDAGWRAIILGSPEAYLDRLLAAGFDGVYLDIIDAYEHFED